MLTDSASPNGSSWAEGAHELKWTNVDCIHSAQLHTFSTAYIIHHLDIDGLLMRSELARAHTLDPVDIAPHRRQILAPAWRDKHRVLDAHTAHALELLEHG
jgi:hypothetical protein